MSYNKKILSAIDRDLRDQYRSKRYSKSLSATNSVFAPNHLFSKPSPRRIYNPNAQFFETGGSTGPCPEGLTYDPETRKCIPYKAYEQKYNVSEEIISNVNDDYRENLKWFKDYYNSPRYKEMVRGSVEASGGPGNVDESTQNIITSRDAQLWSQEPVVVTSKDGYIKHHGNDEVPLGSSHRATGRINIIAHPEHFDKGFREGTLTHEISHSSDRPFYHSDYWKNGYWADNSDDSRQIPQSDIDYIESKKPKYIGSSREYWNNKQFWDWLRENDIDAYREYQQHFMDWTDYVSDPTETRARLNDLRKLAQDQGIYDPFTEKIDEDAFRKLKGQLDSDKQGRVKGLKELQDAFSDEEIKWMLNNISKNEETSDVLDMQYAQDGGGVSPIEGDLISKIIMERNRGVDFVDRAFALGENPGTPLFNVPDDEQFGQTMSHKMAYGTDDSGQTYMFPTVLNPNDEAIAVPNQYADYISREGYKNATGMNNNDNFLDLELTDEEIQKYVDGGYIVEDLPKAQRGGGVKALINYGKKVKDATKIIKTAVPKKPLIKTTVNSGSDLLQGLSHGVKDLITTDRNFTEVFPITNSQKKGADLLAESALEEGVKFVDDWFYTFDPNFGKVLRPEISDKILDIYELGDPRNRSSRFFYEQFRPEGGGKFNLGTIWDDYDHRAVTPLDNTPIYGVNTFGINQNNPFVFTRNMLRGNTRNILADPSLSDAQKIKLINSRVTRNTLGTNYAHMPDVRLSVTDYKRGPYRFDPKHVYETVIHEGTHTGQLLGTPNLGFGKIITKWDPDKGYYYANENTPIGRFYKSIMPDKDWTGSPNELHAELMVARSRLYDGWKNNTQVKNAFKTDFNTGRTLSIPERDEKIREWAFNELRNPTNQTLDDLISYGDLNRFFKKGVPREKKYDALRYLPGLAIPFALPSLTDDSKPKLQYGGALELGDEVTEDMVEELRRQGYTLEEI